VINIESKEEKGEEGKVSMSRFRRIESIEAGLWKK
jgi:hypothetical protein